MYFKSNHQTRDNLNMEWEKKKVFWVIFSVYLFEKPGFVV